MVIISVNIQSKGKLKRIASVNGTDGFMETDPGLSETSENPVQNKVITTKFRDMEKRLVNLEQKINEFLNT